MKDTHPSIEDKFIKMIMKKSGEERIKMGCDMNETARRLVIASVFQKDRSSSEEDIRIAILDRFYGNEVSPETKKEFIRKIRLKLDT
ncbi:MAG: hypothetical protein A2X59_02700 [Nitrospirae bacterium GWC2_42_7]|nr:MAG: hypothetical protein A2X59_02700 [Nitrospirae bacterium GWC2_42_7]